MHKVKNKIIKKPEKKITKILRLSLTLIIFVGFIVGIYLLLKFSGALDEFDDVEDLTKFIKETGIYGLLVFFVLQFLQVTILPLPGFVTTIAGSIVFGPLPCFAVSSFAIILGSICSFALGRKFGNKLLIWCVGIDDAKHWKEVLTECKYAFFLMMLFPFFPDDILCLVAGVTNMSYKFFLITNLITRPVSVFCTCYIGSGYLIPFKGWGIGVWIFMVVAIVVLFLLSAKYQTKIEQFITKLSKKFTKKQKHNVK